MCGAGWLFVGLVCLGSLCGDVFLVGVSSFVVCYGGVGFVGLCCCSVVDFCYKYYESYKSLLG